jgi:hypothetical protein
LWHLDAARVRYAAHHHGVWAALAVAALTVPGLLAFAVKHAFGARKLESAPGRLEDAK